MRAIFENQYKVIPSWPVSVLSSFLCVFFFNLLFLYIRRQGCGFLLFQTNEKKKSSRTDTFFFCSRSGGENWYSRLRVLSMILPIVFFFFLPFIHSLNRLLLLFLPLLLVLPPGRLLPVLGRRADEEVELAEVEVDSAGEASAPGVGTSWLCQVERERTEKEEKGNRKGQHASGSRLSLSPQRPNKENLRELMTG